MKRLIALSAFVAGLALAVSAGWARPPAQITSYDNFVSDALYASWAPPNSTIVSGPTSYSITATGYGSNYKYIEDPSRIGGGNTHLELTASLSGPPAADGQLGPIVTLIDTDGTRFNFAWYGQTLGSHVLTMPVDAPTWVDSPGSTPGLNLDGLQHMHMQLDPGGFGTQGAYTVVWENLALVVVPEPGTLGVAGVAAALALARRRSNRHSARV